MGCSLMESPAPPSENRGGRRLVSGTPRSGTPSPLWPDLRRPGVGDTKEESAPAPSPGPTLRQGTKATFTAGGGGCTLEQRLPNSQTGTESTAEQGSKQGPGAGWRAALSPTLTIPGDTRPGPISPLSRHWRERPPPRPCEAPRNQKPHHLSDEFINKEETERPARDEHRWVN